MLTELGQARWGVGFGSAVAMAVEDEDAKGLLMVGEDSWESCQHGESLESYHCHFLYVCGRGWGQWGGVRGRLKPQESVESSIGSWIGGEMKRNSDNESVGEVKEVNTHHECQQRIASAAGSMQ